VTSEELGELAKRAAHASGALQVILFGSAARGNAVEGSDLDLLLVLPDDADLTEALKRANLALYPRPVPLDLVPMRRSHLEAGASVLAREGITLYER